MFPPAPETYKKIGPAILWIWLGLSLYPAYGDYLAALSKMKNHDAEHINVYFTSSVIEKLGINPDNPVLVILPPALTVDERWFYHFRIRYRLYPQKIDFAEILPGQELKKISYDYRTYQSPLPVTFHPSNLIPLNTSDYSYILAIAGARPYLSDFRVITDAPDVKGIVYERIWH